MRLAFNRFVERHEVAWELGMATLAIIYLVLGIRNRGRQRVEPG